MGVIIDVVGKIDEARWEKKTPAAHDDSDVKPLLTSSPYHAEPSSTKHKYSRITDEQLDKLGKYEGSAKMDNSADE